MSGHHILPPFVARSLVWEAGKPARPVDVDPAVLACHDEGTFVWIHIFVHNPVEVRPILEDRLGFHPTSVDDALATHISPGVEDREGYLYFAVPAPAHHTNRHEFRQLAFFLREHNLITVSRYEIPVIDDTFKRLNTDRRIAPSSASVSHAILDAIVDDFFPVLDGLHEQIEKLEDGIYDARRIEPRNALEIKHGLLLLRKRISPLRDTLNSLLRRESEVIRRDVMADFQDVYDHTLRVTESIDLGRDLLSTIMDAQLNIVSNRLNEVMRILTVISTLMMASSLIAGIYGMNFKHMPELDWRLGYPFAIGLMILVCTGILWLFRKREWI